MNNEYAFKRESENFLRVVGYRGLGNENPNHRLGWGVS